MYGAGSCQRLRVSFGVQCAEGEKKLHTCSSSDPGFRTALRHGELGQLQNQTTPEAVFRNLIWPRNP